MTVAVAGGTAGFGSAVISKRELVVGECLFREGDVAQEAYVIESGSIEIVSGEGVTRTRIALLGPTDIFGEMTLLGDRQRSASAFALAPTRLTVVTHEYLGDRLSEADPMLRHLLRVLIMRSRDLLGHRGGTAAPSPPVDPAGQRDLDSAMARLDLEQALAQALGTGGLELHLQPIIGLARLDVSGFEALLRWNRPGRGWMPPGEFIPVVEHSELMVPLGRWVIREACRVIAQLRRAGAPGLYVAVNLSARQFGDTALLSVVEEALEAEALPADALRLEVTESMLPDNLVAARQLLERCRERGLKVVIDDFGTGYSSLSYLHRFPVDVLKLDRSFIRDMEHEPRLATIVRGVVRLAHELGMETVGEGVETVLQLEALRSLGADHVQGYYFSRALPLAEAEAYLLKGPP